jgi:replicative DNA helicase
MALQPSAATRMSAEANHHHRADAPVDIHRTPPHNMDAEQGLLGSMLISPQEVIPLVESQPPELFYVPAHATIFGVLLEMHQVGKPADLITLTKILRDRNLLDGVGGPAFITHLVTFTPTAANASYYLEIVYEQFTLREMIRVGTRFVSRAYGGHEEAEALRDDFEAQVLALPSTARTQAVGDDPRANTLLALESLEAIWQGNPGAVGIPLGLAALDKMLGGAKPGEMIVLAARPSVGKSALALNIIESVAVDQKLPVGLFTLEMADEAQRRRLICSRARVNLEKVRNRIATDADFMRMTQAGSAVADAPIYMDDKRELSIAEVRARARRWHQKYGLRLLVIDYLQLLRSTSKQAKGSREREISEVSEGIKSLAGELRIPIIALSQLNREMERAGRKPRLSDLRESGSLEQDADVVLLLHRAEMLAENEDERLELDGKAELIVAKQREGPIGSIMLSFHKGFTRFEQ